MTLENEQVYKSLRLIDRRFNQAVKRGCKFLPTEVELLSKLAVIELGGWVEESIDDCLMCYLRNHLSDSTEIDKIKKDVINHVYGFSFATNVLPLLERILGVVNCRNLIAPYVISGDLEILKSELGNLKVHRDNAAHKNWSGTSLNYPAPSVMIARYKKMYPIVTALKKQITKI